MYQANGTTRLRISAQRSRLMLCQAQLEIVGVSNVVGTISALKNVYPESHPRAAYTNCGGLYQRALTLRQAQGERGTDYS